MTPLLTYVGPACSAPSCPGHTEEFLNSVKSTIEDIIEEQRECSTELLDIFEK